MHCPEGQVKDFGIYAKLQEGIKGFFQVAQVGMVWGDVGLWETEYDLMHFKQLIHSGCSEKNQLQGASSLGKEINWQAIKVVQVRDDDS